MKMKWEIWKSEDELELQLHCPSDPIYDGSKLLDTLGRPMKLFKSYEASDFNDACTKRNELLGWGPYKSFKD